MHCGQDRVKCTRRGGCGEGQAWWSWSTSERSVRGATPALHSTALLSAGLLHWLASDIHYVPFRISGKHHASLVLLVRGSNVWTSLCVLYIHQSAEGRCILVFAILWAKGHSELKSVVTDKFYFQHGPISIKWVWFQDTEGSCDGTCWIHMFSELHNVT